MNMKINACCIFTAFLVIAVCSGCRHTQKEMAPGLGGSYQAAFSRQIINPDAPEDPGPVNTLPGGVGNQIYHKKYVKSLTEDNFERQNDVGRELRSLD